MNASDISLPTVLQKYLNNEEFRNNIGNSFVHLKDYIVANNLSDNIFLKPFIRYTPTLYNYPHDLNTHKINALRNYVNGYIDQYTINSILYAFYNENDGFDKLITNDFLANIFIIHIDATKTIVSTQTNTITENNTVTETITKTNTKLDLPSMCLTEYILGLQNIDIMITILKRLNIDPNIDVYTKRMRVPLYQLAFYNEYSKLIIHLEDQVCNNSIHSIIQDNNIGTVEYVTKNKNAVTLPFDDYVWLTTNMHFFLMLFTAMLCILFLFAIDFYEIYDLLIIDLFDIREPIKKNHICETHK